MKESKPIVEYTNKEGNRIIKVPLGRNTGKYAEIDATEWGYLRELGLSPNWSIGANNNVKAHCGLSPNNYVLVARVLLDCGEQEIVKYKDLNPLNLRNSNIMKLFSPRKGLKSDRILVIKAKNRFNKLETQINISH